jgi:hypothetical protein
MIVDMDGVERDRPQSVHEATRNVRLSSRLSAITYPGDANR